MVIRIIPPATDAPPGTAPTLRAIIDRIYELENARTSDLTAQTATDKGQAATLQALSRQINALPVPTVVGGNATGFGLSAGWTTYVTVNVTVPTGKTVANIMATGGAAAVDTGTGGLTTSYARVQIDTSTSVQYAAAKDAGTSAVNNILTVSHALVTSVTPGQVIPIRLQINPLNAAAFPTNPGNYASISVIAVFTN